MTRQHAHYRRCETLKLCRHIIISTDNNPISLNPSWSLAAACAGATKGQIMFRFFFFPIGAALLTPSETLAVIFREDFSALSDSSYNWPNKKMIHRITTKFQELSKETHSDDFKETQWCFILGWLRTKSRPRHTEGWKSAK